MRIEEAAARRVLRKEMPDLVYLNTVLSACYVRPALDLGLRVVLHSHELGRLASGPLSRYRLEGSYDRIHLVACSEAARAELQRITGVDAIDVLPSVVDVDRISRMSEEPLGDLRSALDHGSESGLVVACGTADETKGADTWLQVASAVKRRLGQDCPYFVWIGADEGGRYSRQSRGMRLDDRVRFVGVMDNPQPVIAAADIVSVPSRQDSFPLVVLEGMALGRPIVAFDVGGLAEQLGHTGVLVPAGDVDAMADAVVRLMGDEGKRHELSAAGRQRVQDLYSVGVFRDRLAKVLGAAMEPGSLGA